MNIYRNASRITRQADHVGCEPPKSRVAAIGALETEKEKHESSPYMFSYRVYRYR